MSELSICAIWGTPATETPDDRDGRTMDSPRAGGKYFISRTADTVLQSCDDSVKVRLTNWLVEQRRIGNSCPEISSKVIDDAKRRRNSYVFDRADRVLKYLAERSEILGTQVWYRMPIDNFYVAQLNNLDKVYLELLSHSDCIGYEDFLFLLTYLEQRGLIKRSSINNPEQTCTLTVEGYARVSELENSYIASSRAFVAMWFDRSMRDTWIHGFDPAIREAGYEPVRIDKKEHVNKIDDEIVAEIRRSCFVVADFTHGSAGARGGVYYEAGLAHGLNIPVIFSCREDVLQEVHFDTRQYNHLVWKTAEELRGKLVNRISAVIGDGPNKRPS